MKTYHIDSNDKIWTEAFHEKMDKTVFQQDLAPYVKYSLNKKKRWETGNDKNYLSEVQKRYRGMDMFVIDRVRLNSSPYFCFISRENFFHNYFLQFPIRQLHQLNADNSYSYVYANQTYGQSYKSLQPENRSPSKSKSAKKPELYQNAKVAYHIITPPKNYEKLQAPKFCPGSSDRNLTHRTLAHWRRVKRMRDALLSLRYEKFEVLDEEVDMVDDYLIFDQYDPPRKFYNLADHFIIKSTFMESGASSTWSII